MNKTGLRLSKRDILKLQNYSWQGNIRELENVIERGVILSRNGRLCFELPEVNQVTTEDMNVSPVEPGIKTAADIRSDERDNIIHALKLSRGKVFGHDGAATALNIPPTTLASKIKRLNIDRSAFK